MNGNKIIDFSVKLVKKKLIEHNITYDDIDKFIVDSFNVENLIDKSILINYKGQISDILYAWLSVLNEDSIDFKIAIKYLNEFLIKINFTKPDKEDKKRIKIIYKAFIDNPYLYEYRYFIFEAEKKEITISDKKELNKYFNQFILVNKYIQKIKGLGEENLAQFYCKELLDVLLKESSIGHDSSVMEAINSLKKLKDLVREKKWGDKLVNYSFHDWIEYLDKDFEINLKSEIIKEWIKKILIFNHISVLEKSIYRMFQHFEHYEIDIINRGYNEEQKRQIETVFSLFYKIVMKDKILHSGKIIYVGSRIEDDLKTDDKYTTRNCINFFIQLINMNLDDNVPSDLEAELNQLSKLK